MIRALLTKRLVSSAASLTAAVLVGCILPTPVCGCSPATVSVAITGIVLDAEGAPSSAATVVVTRGSVSSCALVATDMPRRVTSGADGHFAFAEAVFTDEPGCLRLYAEPPEGTTLRASAVQSVRFRGGAVQPAPTTLRLQPALSATIASSADRALTPR
jgi:hypothetical protein